MLASIAIDHDRTREYSDSLPLPDEAIYGSSGSGVEEVERMPGPGPVHRDETSLPREGHVRGRQVGAAEAEALSDKTGLSRKVRARRLRG